MEFIRVINYLDGAYIHLLLQTDHKPVFAYYNLAVLIADPRQERKVYQEQIRALDKAENSSIPVLKLRETEINFGKLSNTAENHIHTKGTISVENVGPVVAQWQLTDNVPKWLTFVPATGELEPEEAEEIEVEVHLCEETAGDIFGEQVEKLDEIVVMNVIYGAQLFIMFSGKLEWPKRSSFQGEEKFDSGCDFRHAIEDQIHDESAGSPLGRKSGRFGPVDTHADARKGSPSRLRPKSMKNPLALKGHDTEDQENNMQPRESEQAGESSPSAAKKSIKNMANPLVSGDKGYEECANGVKKFENPLRPMSVKASSQKASNPLGNRKSHRLQMDELERASLVVGESGRSQAALSPEEIAHFRAKMLAEANEAEAEPEDKDKPQRRNTAKISFGEAYVDSEED
jgi:hypothetical protein